MNKKEFIKITSPNQFEIRAGYLANKEIKKINYHINIYIFLPKNLGINRQTYANNDFYNDFISHIRLITPKNDIEILSKELQNIIISLENNIDNYDEKENISKKLKILVCSYVTYLRDFSKDIKNANVKPPRIGVFLDRIKEFHNIKKRLSFLSARSNDEELIFLLNSSAEYISLVTQHYLFEINVYLRNSDNKQNKMINDIVILINEELIFCKENNFPIISSDDYENEKVIYRYSVFKKYFYSILYLYQNRKKDGAGIKEFYYAIAAGISMLFTTIVIFAAKLKYGSLTASLFVALIISYMFKDRLKEAYRHYFDKKMRMKIYDFKERIYDIEKKSLFCFIKERMRFIKKENLDSDIIKTRLKTTDSRLSTWYIGEDIIKYEKNITLYNKNIQGYYNNTISGIHNIMRFDISKFLTKMDAPKVPLYRMNNNSLYGDKVYHVNIVVEFQSKDEKTLHRARLILTKKGIKRIELPEYDIKLFKQNRFKKEENWFSLKKSGLLKKLS